MVACDPNAETDDRQVDVEQINRVLSQHEFQHLGEATNSSLPPYDYYPDGVNSSSLAFDLTLP